MSSDRVVANVISLSNSSTVVQVPTTGTNAFKIDLAAMTITIDSTSAIDAIARGFLGGGQTGNPFGGNGTTLGFAQGSTGSSGGSHGGLGGLANGSPNPLYGATQDPKDSGSGGATILRTGGNGGGVIRVAAQSLTVNGGIRAGGGSGIGDSFAAGGSGGSIRVDTGILTGTGQIVARGGNGLSSSGGGGGGRIAIYYLDATGFNLGTQVLATWGTGNGAPNGKAGTIHLQQQVAMFTPILEDAPVLKAEVQNSTSSGPFRLASAEVQNAKAETQENLFLALLSSSSSPGAAEFHNPKSKICPEFCERIENTKLDDLDPIYTYDLNGNRTSMIDPTGLTTYSYDALNRLTLMTNNKGQTTTFTYDALGRRSSMTHANGVVTNYSYDAASQLLSIAHHLGTTTIDSFAYTYDKVGNRNSKANNNGIANYTYDALNRLVQSINPLPSNPLESFTYDPVGNRVNSNQNGASTFNQANQLLEDANFTYQYDNNGNMIRKTAKAGGMVTNYEYDAENKLARVQTATRTVNYKYDGLGRRVEKEVIDMGTTTTRYVYDNEDILLELNGANTIVARYTHGPGIDEPLIMEKNNQSFYYHADGLGSITEITNQSGTVLQRYAYSLFGKIESQLDSNFVQPYTFTARELDSETGLHFYRTRNYDPSAGRFVQPDPVGFFGGPNFYAYTGNNPIGRIDPYGLDWLSNLSNFSAGAGDFLSGGFMNSLNLTERFLGHRAIPISQLLRQELVATIGLNDMVDQCSTAYAAGKYAGLALGMGIIWSAGLNGGANSVPWSGFKEGARTAAQELGTTVGATPIGHVIEDRKSVGQ